MAGTGGCWGLRDWKACQLRCGPWSRDVTGVLCPRPWGKPCAMSRASTVPSQCLFWQRGCWSVWGHKDLGSIFDKGGMVWIVPVTDQIFFLCVHHELWQFASANTHCVSVLPSERLFGTCITFAVGKWTVRIKHEGMRTLKQISSVLSRLFELGRWDKSCVI